LLKDDPGDEVAGVRRYRNPEARRSNVRRPFYLLVFLEACGLLLALFGGLCRLAYLGPSGMAAAHHRSELLNEKLGDESVCSRLIFPAGITRGREVVGHGRGNEAN
jgi:hypothetical protein